MKLCSCLIVYVLSSELHDGPLTVKVRPTCQMKVHKPKLTLTVLQPPTTQAAGQGPNTVGGQFVCSWNFEKRRIEVRT